MKKIIKNIHKLFPRLNRRSNLDASWLEQCSYNNCNNDIKVRLREVGLKGYCIKHTIYTMLDNKIIETSEIRLAIDHSLQKEDKNSGRLGYYNDIYKRYKQMYIRELSIYFYMNEKMMFRPI